MDDSRSKSAFVLELPSNDTNACNMPANQVLMARKESKVGLISEESGTLCRNGPVRDSGLVIVDDNGSSFGGSEEDEEEAVPDTPPDYDDAPLDALERGAAALAAPTVVAGGVGQLHLNINSGTRMNRTSCSYEGLTEDQVETSPTEADGDALDGGAEYQDSSRGDKVFTEVTHDDCKHFSGGNHYHTHHHTNINLHVHSLGGGPELAGVAEQIKQMIERIRFTGGGAAGAAGEDIADIDETDLRRGGDSHHASIRNKTEGTTCRAAPILVRTGGTVDIYNVPVDIHPPLGRQSLWTKCGLGSEWYTTPLRWFISMASILIAGLLIYLLIQLLVLNVENEHSQ